VSLGQHLMLAAMIAPSLRTKTPYNTATEQDLTNGQAMGYLCDSHAFDSRTLQCSRCRHGKKYTSKRSRRDNPETRVR
jgi:hypothetical protein